MLPLKGVQAYVDVRSHCSNHNLAVSDELVRLGATVSKKLDASVTHIIFKDGSKSTASQGIKMGAHVVSVQWLESCKQSHSRVPEHFYHISQTAPSKPKKQKSMQPKDFEQEVKSASDKINRLKRRRSNVFIPSPLSIVADRINMDKYISAPHTPPAMQKRIDQLRMTNGNSLSRLRNHATDDNDLGRTPDVMDGRGLLPATPEQWNIMQTPFSQHRLARNTSTNATDLSGPLFVEETPAVPSFKSSSVNCVPLSPRHSPHSSKSSGILHDCKGSLLQSDLSTPHHVEVRNHLETSSVGRAKRLLSQSAASDHRECDDHWMFAQVNNGRRSLGVNNRSWAKCSESSDAQSSDMQRTSSIAKPISRLSSLIFNADLSDSSDMGNIEVVQIRKGSKRAVASTSSSGSGNSQVSLGRPNIVLTSVHSDDRCMLKSIIKTLGGYKVNKSVTRHTTHVVCGNERRTMNVLFGISQGCWIVSVQWILNSLEMSRWLDEPEFVMLKCFPGANLST